MADLRQREPRITDEKFLSRIRQLPCIVPRCNIQGVEAAHIRMASAAHGQHEAGIGQKPHDTMALPCCWMHHRMSKNAEHVIGTSAFWEWLGMDPHFIAERIYRAHMAIEDDIEALQAMRLIILEERFAAL